MRDAALEARGEAGRPQLLAKCVLQQLHAAAAAFNNLDLDVGSLGFGDITPTTEPADVPITTSAKVRSMPAAERPARMPISHAIPVTPPPPSTSALRTGATPESPLALEHGDAPEKFGVGQRAGGEEAPVLGRQDLQPGSRATRRRSLR